MPHHSNLLRTASGTILSIGVTTALVASAATAGSVDLDPSPCGLCAADIDGDGSVTGADLGVMLGAWGPCAGACVADLDGNGVVDGADLGALLGAWGACPTFEYPPSPEDPEAYQIVMELLGSGSPLLPPPEWVERVARDLELIRVFEPSLAQQFHTPAFQWDFLILQRDQSSDDSEYQCLNDFYQASLWAELEILGLTIIQFPGPLNTPALAPIYESLDHVISASPSGIYGGENFWSPSPFGGLEGVWIWGVDDGFHDCFDGCDCHYYYTFSVSGDGVVSLIAESSQGAPWCPWPK